MSKFSLFFRTLSAALLALSAMAGQPQALSDWSSVTRLPPESDLRLILSNGRTLSGILVAATSASLTLNVSTGQEVHRRQDIRRVQLRGQGRRLRNALVGFGVGAGVGLVAGVGVDRSRSRDSFNIVPNAGVLVLTPIGGIVGTVIGVAWPSGGWRDVYRAP